MIGKYKRTGECWSCGTPAYFDLDNRVGDCWNCGTAPRRGITFPMSDTLDGQPGGGITSLLTGVNIPSIVGATGSISGRWYAFYVPSDDDLEAMGIIRWDYIQAEIDSIKEDEAQRGRGDEKSRRYEADYDRG